jgi:pimeloyl-ACP methyl ester carboxylesterase
MSLPRSVAVDSRVLEVHGLDIAMRVVGAGEPLLLMNGMTRPLQSWESFTHELPGRTIISFDAPGVGASPTPLAPLSIPALAALAV